MVVGIAASDQWASSQDREQQDHDHSGHQEQQVPYPQQACMSFLGAPQIPDGGEDHASYLATADKVKHDRDGHRGGGEQEQRGKEADQASRLLVWIKRESVSPKG